MRANLAAIASRFPALAAALGEAADGGFPEPALGKARNGSVLASLDGVLLSSSYDPEAEARKLVMAQVPPGRDAAVCLGLGSAYLAEACLALDGSLKVLVVEPDARTFLACLAIRPMEGLLIDERVSFSIGNGAGAAIAALDAMGARRPCVLVNRPLARRDPEAYEACFQALGRYASKEAINERTLKRFGSLWIRNLARNADALALYPGIDALRGAFAGLPAMVLAAGPSLDDVLPFLKALAERMLIVCVDTALGSALRAGCAPDFVVVVDPQYWNSRHLDRCDGEGSILVTEAAVWPSVLCRRWRKVFLASSLYPLGRYLERWTGPKGELGAGGSVATSAWDFARILGSSALYMAGLDLGFPGMATHAKESFFERRALMRGRRLSPAEGDSLRAAMDGQAFDALSANGGKVRTDKRLSLYAWWFEARLARHPECRTYSLSPRGLAIPGMALRSIDEALALPEARDRIDSRMGAALASAPRPQDIKVVEEALEGLARALDGIAALCREAEGLAGEAAELCRQGGDPGLHLAELDRLDGRILANEAKDLAGFLMPALDELFGSRPGSLEESLVQSRQVYAEAARSAERHRRLVEKGRRA